MDFKEIVLKNRSYRRFDQSSTITKEQLLQWVDLARQAASGSNLQGLKYYLVWEPEEAQKLFETVTFAAYLRDWAGPQPGEQPAAYIVILGDRFIKPNLDMDCGIAAQTILLGATADGYGGLMMGSFKRDSLSKLLALPENLDILLVLALGKPTEKVVLVPIDETHGVRYYRDENEVHYVPKRALEDIVFWKGSF